jgi:phosphoserine phosphatase RsbU/P
MSLSERAATIAQIPLFAALPDPELELLARTLRECEFSEGALLLREGECDEHFYLLLEGEVEVVKALGTPEERRLAITSRSGLFGEMSLFNCLGSHTASVRARTTALALQMTRPDFDLLLQRCPALTYEMLRQMSQRLEGTENATIIELSEKNRQLTLAYQELQAAQAQIILKEKLEKELSIARLIQESILPETLPNLKGFDMAALTYPARAVGGDYYDFFLLEEGRIGIVIGDACDKGIPAALFINLTNSLVRVEAPRNPSPKAALLLVNEHLLKINRAEMFASLLYCVLDSNGRLEYCRAGHPYPLVLDQDLHPLQIHPCPGMPLGFMEEIQLDAQSLTIPAGGMAVLYSDGLSEALDTRGEQFGEDRLLAELPGLSTLPAAQICACLWDLVQDFAGDEPQSDDFTVIVIKRES